MKKNLQFFLLLTICLFYSIFSFSQIDSTTFRIDSARQRMDSTDQRIDSIFNRIDSIHQRQQIAVFTPLYLDSAFDAGYNYRYGKAFPKFINPGLEFYEGIELAIDSLQKEGVELDVHIYDTRSASTSLNQVIQSDEFNDMDLVIGHVTGSEARLLANAAAKNNTPFINVNHPNDAGVSNNPNYIILNSTLITHFNALYKFLQRNFSLSEIIVFRRKGPQGDLIKNFLTNIEKSTYSVPLKLKYVMLDDNFTEAQLKKHLDSTITNVCIAGSLDTRFAEHLAEHLATLNAVYPVTLFGMPTWDVVDFTRPEFKGLEIYYGTPFYIAPTDKLSESMHNTFRSKFYSRPTDMVFRGFETMYRFAHLLMLHEKNLGSSLSDKKYNVFTAFDIQPVINSKTMTLDYFENKKIYFVKTIDGVVKAAY